MRKWGTWAVAGVLALSVAGLLYAQGRGDAAGIEFRVESNAEVGPRTVVGGEAEKGFDWSRGEFEEEGESEHKSARENEGDRDWGKERFALGHGFRGLHHAGRKAAILLVAAAVIPVLIVLFWVLPIVLGVRIARRKKLSPLWMLFGIHPIGGWVGCLVLALARGKVECGSCGGYIKPNFRQCPYCKGTVAGETATKPKA